MTYSPILFRSLLKHDASSETSPGQLTQTLNDIKVYPVTLAFLCFFFQSICYMYVCVCVLECMYAYHICLGAYRAQKVHWIPWN